jgi:hypothetical protein
MNQKVKIAKVSMGVLAVLVLIGFMSSCEKYTFTPPTINPNDSVHFATEIQPIFSSTASTPCINCHNGAITPDLRAGKSYDALTTHGMITPPATTSILYMQVISAGHTARTSDIQKQKIFVWINQGAHNN